MLKFRFAEEKDINLYYDWANDQAVRENSYNKNKIHYEAHGKWFLSKLNSGMCFFYLFLNENNVPIGQVRIEKNEENSIFEAIIGITIDPKFRGKGLGSEMIKASTKDFLTRYNSFTLIAYVFKSNLASYNSFINAGYILKEEKIIKDIPSYVFIKKNND